MTTDHSSKGNMVLNGTFLIELLGVLIALSAVVYTYFLRSFQYWKKRNVPFIPPKFLLGNAQNPLNRTVSEGIRFKHFYDYFKKNGYKYGGLYQFNYPFLVLTDLELIKTICIKDFDYFMDRDKPRFNFKEEPLGSHLFNYTGTKWRNLRAKLTPTFTSGKLKTMFETLLHCTPPMVKQIEQDLSKPLDIKDYLERFTCDVIGSCAFGLECNSFTDPNSLFRTYSKMTFNITTKVVLIRMFPKIAKALGIRRLPLGAQDFFLDVVRKTMNYRKENKVKRNDFLQLLMEMEDELTFNEIAAQSFLFFIAGFETSATTMTFALYSLAKNPDVQDKLRSEINSVLKKNNNKLTYEVLSEMKYLAQVIDETLRMYPAGVVLPRICVREYKVPNEDLTIKKGMRVVIPVFGIHYDEEYYPNPTKFDPERFNEENKKNISPYAYLPFGEGPRNCIGLRFGLMQVKVGLINLITNFKFTVNPKTEEPLKFSPELFVIGVKEGIWLNAEKV